jgi:hypothetical protein
MLLIMMAAAAASPIYLDCAIQRSTAPPLKIDVVLDEANQKATLSLDTGLVIVRPAVFAPDRVRVPDDETTWTISRVDLGINRTMSFMPPSDPGESGKCALKPAPAKRAF